MTREEFISDHQRDVLVTLVAGERQPYCNPSTRRLMVKKKWITARRDGIRWLLEITDAGRAALETLPRRRPSVPRGLL